MLINYETFRRLYRDAVEQPNFDYYSAERGWQDWMDDRDDTEVVDILQRVYDIAQLDFAGLRTLLGVSQATMARAYGIPLRTLESWESGERTPASYLRPLIAYTIFSGQTRAEVEGL